MIDRLFSKYRAIFACERFTSKVGLKFTWLSSALTLYFKSTEKVKVDKNIWHDTKCELIWRKAQVPHTKKLYCSVDEINDKISPPKWHFRMCDIEIQVAQTRSCLRRFQHIKYNEIKRPLIDCIICNGGIFKIAVSFGVTSKFIEKLKFKIDILSTF